MTDHDKLRIEAERAAIALKGTALDIFVRYLIAESAQLAEEAMFTPNVDDLRRKQGAYRQMVKVIGMLQGKPLAEFKRSKIRS